jgi:hypothetical protein
MSEILVTIHNAETNEIIQRPANEEELKQIEKDRAEVLAFNSAIAAKAAQRAALLERLGITEEEAQLLLGGN